MVIVRERGWSMCSQIDVGYKIERDAKSLSAVRAHHANPIPCIR